MYIDNGDPGDSGELKIDVDGHEYTEQENYSYAQDDTLDSVSVETADGSHLVYTDSDHDGLADLVTEYDADGEDTHTATFDPATSHWTDTGGHDDTPPVAAAADSHGVASVTADITVDTAQGSHDLGPATVDTDSDGTPDTAVTHDADGDLVMYTDTDGDGQADVAVEIAPDGDVVIAQHTGDHEWTEVEKGHLNSDGAYQKDTGAGGAFDPQFSDGNGTQSAQSAHWVDDRAADGCWNAESTAPEPTDAQEGVLDRMAGDAADAVGAVFAKGQGVVRIDVATGQWISPN